MKFKITTSVKESTRLSQKLVLQMSQPANERTKKIEVISQM